MLQSMQTKTQDLLHNTTSSHQSSNGSGKSLEVVGAKCRVTRLVTNQSSVVNTPINAFPSQENFPLENHNSNPWHLKTALQMNTINTRHWHANMSNIFETLQYQKSKSFRRNQVGGKMLFDEVSKTFIIGFQQVQEMQMLQAQNSRKNSQAYSSMSIRSADRRQSVVGGKPAKKSRSQSIISNL